MSEWEHRRLGCGRRGAERGITLEGGKQLGSLLGAQRRLVRSTLSPSAGPCHNGLSGPEPLLGHKLPCQTGLGKGNGDRSEFFARTDEGGGTADLAEAEDALQNRGIHAHDGALAATLTAVAGEDEGQGRGRGRGEGGGLCADK